MPGLRCAALLPSILLLAGPAAGAGGLFSIDIFEPGDGAATRDTVHGLEWLDPTVTAGFSRDEILANALGLVGGGWRYATTAEVCQLMLDFGFAPAPCPGISPVQPDGAALVHLSFLGVLTSLPFGIGVAGVFQDDDAGNPLVGLASIGYFFSNSTVVVVENDHDPTLADPEIGHFLVRTGPTTVPALPAWGSLALAAPCLATGGRRLSGPQRA